MNENGTTGSIRQGVASLNSAKGALTLADGGGLTITRSGNTITLAVGTAGSATNAAPTDAITLPANYSMVVSGSFEIPASKKLLISSGAVLRILKG